MVVVGGDGWWWSVVVVGGDGWWWSVVVVVGVGWGWVVVGGGWWLVLGRDG